MDLSKFKDSIGKNLFAVTGWVALFSYIYCETIPVSIYGLGMYSFILYVGLFVFLIFLSLVIYTIETIYGKRIKNEFILKNKFYNVFWILGVFLSVLFLFSPLIILFL
jgi:uncharacterized BrkB/YihY/UPF0761 family membrane protein